jgi:hypothetical protein
MSPREEFIEDHPQTENVRTAIYPMPLATGLLGTHIKDGPEKLWALADILLLQSQPEIGNIGFAGGIEDDVPWLDISMHKSLAMSIMQGLGDISPTTTASPDFRLKTSI